MEICYNFIVAEKIRVFHRMRLAFMMHHGSV